MLQSAFQNAVHSHSILKSFKLHQFNPYLKKMAIHIREVQKKKQSTNGLNQLNAAVPDDDITTTVENLNDHHYAYECE